VMGFRQFLLRGWTMSKVSGASSHGVEHEANVRLGAAEAAARRRGSPRGDRMLSEVAGGLRASRHESTSHNGA